MEQYKKKTCVVIGLATLVFLVLSLVAASYSAIEYDEAYNATVAKSLALGLGYATQYPFPVLFNIEITTGPALLLPMAAAIRFFGNLHWIPGATNAFISIPAFGLFFLAFALSARAAADSSLRRAALIAMMPVFLVLCFGAGVIGFFSVGLGETGAAAFTLLGQLALANALATDDTRRSAWLGIAGGLSLGLALLFKSIAVLQVAPTLAIAAGLVFASGRRRRDAIMVCGAIAACAAPVLAFWLIALQAIDTQHALKFVQRSGSGLDLFVQPFEMLLELLKTFASRNMQALTQTLGGAVPLALLVAMLGAAGAGVLGRVKQRWRERGRPAATAGASVLRDPIDLWALFVFSGILLGLCWWLPFNRPGWVRHLLPTLLAVLALTAAVPVLYRSKWSSLCSAALGVFLVALMATYGARFADPLGYSKQLHADPDVLGTYNTLRMQAARRLNGQLAAAHYLSALRIQDPQAQLLGCGWWANRDMEYLLPGAGNFADCFAPRTFSPAANRHWYLVIDQIYWNWGHLPIIDEIADRCQRNKIVFMQDSHTVSRCPDSAQAAGAGYPERK